MNDELVINKIKAAVEALFFDTETELVDLVFRFEGGRNVLRFLVDRPGGITVDDCAELSNRISDILEQSDVIGQRYVLEVSSPGLDRSLKTKRDFERALNKKVRFHLKTPVGNKIMQIGVVEKADQDRVFIRTKDGMFLEIVFDNISKAQEEIEF